MRLFTDPTYLRTIHDSLLSGALHKDNTSALPAGLVGIYEEALPSASNVNERKRFLEFFTVWALLKKEVSAAFVVPLLETWTEQQVLEYVGLYSKWFNSPVSGKYVLYHERLRSFLLARMKKIVDQNIRLLNVILLQSESSPTNQEEYINYLQSYYGDHLTLAAYFKTDEDSWYRQLGMLDLKIEKSKWNVSFSDRTRWNSLAVTLAAIEVDEPFLEDIILSQDRLLNTPVNFDSFVKTILEEDYYQLDEHLLYMNNELEKGVFVLALIHRFRSLIDRYIANAKSDKTFVNSQQIENILNELIKRLNTSIQSGVWIAAEDYLYHLNLHLSTLSLDLDVLIDSIITPDPDGDIPFELSNYIPTKLEELNVYSTDFIESYDINRVDYMKRVIRSLIEITTLIIEPEYKGSGTEITEIKKAISNLGLDGLYSDNKIVQCVLRLKDMLALTANFELTYEFNQQINYIVSDCILYGSNTQDLTWLLCYVNPTDYYDTVMYYRLIRNVMQTPDFVRECLFNNHWRSKEMFMAAANATAQIHFAKGKNDMANKFMSDSIDYFFSYQLTDKEVVRISSQLKYGLSQTIDFEKMESMYRKMEFNHIPTIAHILCKKYSFLDLASLLWYDASYLSGVAENKLWTNEIVKGIVLSLGGEKSYQYFMLGLEQYISVMGSFNSESYNQESNRPAGNTWKLEWWVIGNFVMEYEHFMDKHTFDQLFDYSSTNEYVASRLFDNSKYYDDIDTIFGKYGYDPDINLYAAINLWRDHPSATRKEDAFDRLFNYYTKPIQTLLEANNYLHNRVAVNNISTAISEKRNYGFIH